MSNSIGQQGNFTMLYMLKQVQSLKAFWSKVTAYQLVGNCSWPLRDHKPTAHTWAQGGYRGGIPHLELKNWTPLKIFWRATPPPLELILLCSATPPRMNFCYPPKAKIKIGPPLGQMTVPMYDLHLYDSHGSQAKRCVHGTTPGVPILEGMFDPSQHFRNHH